MLLSWLKLLNRFPLHVELNPNYLPRSMRVLHNLGIPASSVSFQDNPSSLPCYGHTSFQAVCKRAKVLSCNKALNFDHPMTLFTPLPHLVASQSLGLDLDTTSLERLFLTLCEVDPYFFRLWNYHFIYMFVYFKKYLFSSLETNSKKSGVLFIISVSYLWCLLQCLAPCEWSVNN